MLTRPKVVGSSVNANNVVPKVTYPSQSAALIPGSDPESDPHPLLLLLLLLRGTAMLCAQGWHKIATAMSRCSSLFSGIRRNDGLIV